jgi:Uma2 family endonuclease
MGAPLTIPRRTLTVDQYHKMADAGIFHEDDRIELIEGEMIEMAPIGPAHVSKVNELCAIFVRAVAESAIVSIQNPVALPPNNELQPDLALLKPAAHKYKSSLPRPSEILLLVEVADTTLAYDRDVKIPIYASHGIGEVWLLDVRAESLSVFQSPVANVYSRVWMPGKNDTVSLLLLPHVNIHVMELWQ